MVSLNETIYIAFRVQMDKAANDINRGLRAANRSVIFINGLAFAHFMK